MNDTAMLSGSPSGLPVKHGAQPCVLRSPPITQASATSLELADT
jgi:hypothetical protein